MPIKNKVYLCMLEKEIDKFKTKNLFLAYPRNYIEILIAFIYIKQSY